MSDKIENRNRAVLDAAIELAETNGYSNITRDLVAERAGVAAGSVHNAYGDMAALKDAVIAAAVERQILPIVGQALAARHPVALKAPEELKAKALSSLAA